MEIRRVLSYWKRTFSDWRYVFLGVVVAILFYALNVLIAQWRALGDFYSGFGFIGTIKFFLILTIGFGNTIYLYSYMSLIIISLLFGMLFSLIFYKVRNIKGVGNKKVGFFASFGVFMGALLPGCAACGIGLASTLGLSAAIITFFPFNGFELSVLAVGVLIIAIFKTSNDSCKVMFNKRMKGGKR
jgi:hypothetical protein